MLLPEVDRAPLQGPFASSPGVALIEGSLSLPIPGLLPFPKPAVVLGLVFTPGFGTVKLCVNGPLYTPTVPAVPCAKAVVHETDNAAAKTIVAVIFFIATRLSMSENKPRNCGKFQSTRIRG